MVQFGAKSLWPRFDYVSPYWTGRSSFCHLVWFGGMCHAVKCPFPVAVPCHRFPISSSEHNHISLNVLILFLLLLLSLLKQAMEASKVHWTRLLIIGTGQSVVRFKFNHYDSVTQRRANIHFDCFINNTTNTTNTTTTTVTEQIWNICDHCPHGLATIIYLHCDFEWRWQFIYVSKCTIAAIQTLSFFFVVAWGVS